MPKNVIIVGMPRSGTSMTASIFVRRGYFAAEEENSHLRDGDSFNPGGYFEADDLIEANVEVLKRVGYEHHNTWKFDPFRPDQVENIASLSASDSHVKLVQSFDQHAPWVWKDPRLCYTLGYWWPLVNHSNTRVLLLRRNADDIFKSFKRVGWRNESPEDKRDVQTRTQDHIREAEKAIRFHGIPYCEIDYSDFRNDVEKVIATIESTLGILLTREDLGFRPEFDHSSGRGSVERFMEKIADRMPKSIVAAGKALIPNRVLRFFFPTHFS